MTPEQFWSKVDRDGPYHPRMKSRCWMWTGSQATSRIFGLDYGELRWNGRTQHAHRIAWELTYGVQVPRELFACHACDTPRCCNPTHIWIGTKQHNAIDRVLKGRTGRVNDWGPFAGGRMDYAPERKAA